MGRIPENVMHKLSLMDRSLDYASNREAARYLNIAESTLRKWWLSADYTSVRSLVQSLDGIPGPKLETLGGGLLRYYDQYEGWVILFRRHFPRWNSEQITLALQKIGVNAPREAVDFFVLLYNREDEDFDATDTFTPDRTGVEIMSELHDRMMYRAFIEKPVRFLAILLRSLEQNVRSGKMLMKILGETGIEADSVGIDPEKIRMDLKTSADFCSQVREALQEIGTATEAEP